MKRSFFIAAWLNPGCGRAGGEEEAGPADGRDGALRRLFSRSLR